MPDMGPFAIFIWGSYGSSSLGIAGLVIHALRQPKP